MTRLALAVAFGLAAAWLASHRRRPPVTVYRESDDGIQPPDPGLALSAYDFLSPEARVRLNANLREMHRQRQTAAGEAGRIPLA